MSPRGPIGGARRRALRRLARRDVITTREGWVVDLAGPQRIDAVRVLAPDDSPEVERALVDALADPLDEVRAEVVVALHTRESASGARRCAAAAAGWDHHRYALSRSCAWAYLRDCAGPDDAAPLAGSLLLAESAPAVDPVALDALERALGGDADVRIAVLEHTLGVLDDDDPAVVARARQISIRIAAHDPAPVAAVLDDDRRALVAARILGEIGDLRCTPDLGALLSPARPAAVRAAGAAALGALGGQRAARILVAHVDDPDPTVRRAATDALAPLAGLLALDEAEPDAASDGLIEVAHDAVGDDVAAAEQEEWDEAVAVAVAVEPSAQPDVAPTLEIDAVAPEPRAVDAWEAEAAEPEPEPEPELVGEDVPEPVDETPSDPAPAELARDAEPVAVVAGAVGPAQADALHPARNGATVADVAAATEGVQAVTQAAMAEQAEAEAETGDAVASPEAVVATTDDDVAEAARPESNGQAGPLEAAAAVDQVLAEDGEARWNRSTGPVPAGPPPRPRGAKRSRRRR